MSRWFLLKDILLTGTGVGLMLSQIFSAHPSGLLLGTALALTVPSIADHVRALLPSAGGDGESSPSTSQSRPLPSPGSTSSRPGDTSG